MSAHHLSRALDLASDPRMPYNIIAVIMRTRRLPDVMNQDEADESGKLLLALTFDVEHDCGRHNARGDGTSILFFLEHLPEEIRNATLFIEGELVAEYAEALGHRKKEGMELGLHGYRHELWGRPQWYLGDKPLSTEEKRRLLERAIEQFEGSSLGRPLAFRAPNLVADDSTVRLLAEKEFIVDSSLPSHRGGLPIPQSVASAKADACQDSRFRRSNLGVVDKRLPSTLSFPCL